jgi:hypothetical protein
VSILLRVPCQQRQIQKNSQPVSVDEEKYGKEAMYGCFGDDVGVEAVAKIDGVDVVTTAQRHAMLAGEVEWLGSQNKSLSSMARVVASPAYQPGR